MATQRPRAAAAAAVICSIVALQLNYLAMQVSAIYACPSATTTLYDLEPCLVSFEGPSPLPPNDDCCYVIRTTEPGCLCMAVAGYQKSPSVNIRAALNLPKDCGRVVPVNFTCNGIPVPSAGLPPTRKLKL